MVHRGNTQEIIMVHLTVKCNMPKVNAHFLCLKKQVGIFFNTILTIFRRRVFMTKNKFCVFYIWHLMENVKPLFLKVGVVHTKSALLWLYEVIQEDGAAILSNARL